MSRQEFMSVTELAKNKIIERLVTKYDVQAACDAAKDKILGTLNAFHQENVAQIRQINAQRDQVWRKTSALEGQVVALQQEVRALHQLISKIYGAVPR